MTLASLVAYKSFLSELYYHTLMNKYPEFKIQFRNKDEIELLLFKRPANEEKLATSHITLIEDEDEDEVILQIVFDKKRATISIIPSEHVVGFSLEVLPTPHTLRSDFLKELEPIVKFLANYMGGVWEDSILSPEYEEDDDE